MVARKPKTYQLTWYPRHMERALEGMRDLKPDERGVYNTILDLIYLRSDQLVDHDQRIAVECNCGLRAYRTIKATLMEAGKLYLETVDGVEFLRNPAAREEVSTALIRLVAKANAGVSSADKRAQLSGKSNEINADGSTPVATPVEQVLQQTPPHTYTYSNKNKPSKVSTSPARAGRLRSPEGATPPRTPDSGDPIVKAFYTALDDDDLARWTAINPSVRLNGKGYVVTCPTPAKRDYIARLFTTKLRPFLKDFEVVVEEATPE